MNPLRLIYVIYQRKTFILLVGKQLIQYNQILPSLLGYARNHKVNSIIATKFGKQFRETRKHFRETSVDPLLEFLVISGLKFHIMAAW